MSQPEPGSSWIGITKVLFRTVMLGDWDEVIDIYKNDPTAPTAAITTSSYTALHMAVSDGREDIVARLIEALEEYDEKYAKEALEKKNEEGNTPLHIAASMGNVRMCKLLAHVDRTLIGIQNKDGETPLFLAALHGKKNAFLCLHSSCLPDVGSSYCRRKDGETILHCTIAGENFELAFQIIHLYKDLVNCVNSEGNTPLHVLATKSLAFESGSKLGRFQKILYKILSVDKLKAPERHQEEEPIKNDPIPSCPQNYQTLVNFFNRVRQILKCDAISRKHAEEETIENPTNKETIMGSCLGQEGDQSALETREKDFVPPNYVTCFEFVKVVYKALFVFTGPGYDGVTNIHDEKRKHTWSVQVLEELLQYSSLYEREDSGQAPSIDHIDSDLEQELSKLAEGFASQHSQTKKKKYSQTKKKDSAILVHSQTKKKDSAILVAAKHGIKEIVEKILKKFPVAIHDTQENKKNIVLIAVENRRLEVYKLLLRECAKNEGMFRKVDTYGNGALHFAAKHRKTHPRWPIPGDALQMQWEIKWLKFVEESQPKHFFVRYNRKGKTPDDIFTKTHDDLVNGGGKWMKSTAESCSLVAALIATVAFATSTSLPGGVDDQSGKPHLETKPGFQVFAIASLIALCFSVTSLVMFLAILTSRYQEKDFGRDLPWKLLLGLTSLFVSIASMLVSFCAGHFFVLEDTIRYAAFPVYALTGVPVTFFAAAQFPLYFDLIRATFRSPFGGPTKSS